LMTLGFPMVEEIGKACGTASSPDRRAIGTVAQLGSRAQNASTAGAASADRRSGRRGKAEQTDRRGAGSDATDRSPLAEQIPGTWVGWSDQRCAPLEPDTVAESVQM